MRGTPKIYETHLMQESPDITQEKSPNIGCDRYTQKN